MIGGFVVVVGLFVICFYSFGFEMLVSIELLDGLEVMVFICGDIWYVVVIVDN